MPPEAAPRESTVHSGGVLGRVMAFLEDVGIHARLVRELAATGFIDDVAIVHGRLEVTERAAASAVLHEAGHLAIVPAPYRHLLDGNVSGGLRKMFRQIQRLDLDPDHPMWRAAIQASDPEATAWAWAAGCAIGLDPSRVIEDHEYDNSGREIRAMLRMRQYVGINGLVHAGMCLNPRRPTGFPTMHRWVQPGFGPQDEQPPFP